MSMRVALGRALRPTMQLSIGSPATPPEQFETLGLGRLHNRFRFPLPKAYPRQEQPKPPASMETGYARDAMSVTIDILSRSAVRPDGMNASTSSVIA